MPFVSIAGINDDRLSFLGYEMVHETDLFKFYEDSVGRVSVADKQDPYIWMDDMNDAIQAGSVSIVTKTN